MANIVDILLKVKDQASADLADFRKSLKATGEVGSIVADNLGKLSLAGAAAGLKAFGQNLIENTKALSEEAKQLTNLSEQAGFSTQTIQGLSFAAENLGIDTGDATDFLRDFNFEVGEAAIKGSNAENKFRNLGVSIRDNDGILKDNDTLLREVATALSSVEDTAQRAALAAQLFGEDNQKLLPILSQGAEGINNYVAELERMGAVIDDVAIRRLQEFDETITNIQQNQKQLQIESIETAQAAAKVSEIWSIGINSVSKAFLSLVDSQDDTVASLNEYSRAIEENNRQRERAEVTQVRTVEVIEEEREELEKLIATQLKQSEATRKQEKAREDLARDIQNQIDLLKAEQAISGTEAAGLRRGVREREIEAEIEKLRERGAEEEQLEELRRLKLEELNDEVNETTESVDRSTETMKEYRETVDEAEESTRRVSDSMERVSESSQKAAGGLADAFTGLDRIGARAFEFMGAAGGISPTGATAFGTAGLANQAESLLLVADRARAEALRETITQAQQGIIEIGDDVLNRYIEEFNQLSRNLGGLGQIRGDGGQGAILGERKVTIEFNPNQDFDNLSISSQRQLAEQIAQAAEI